MSRTASVILDREKNKILFSFGNSVAGINLFAPGISIENTPFCKVDEKISAGQKRIEQKIQYRSGEKILDATVLYELSDTDSVLRKTLSFVPYGFADGTIVNEIIMDEIVGEKCSFMGFENTTQNYPFFFGNYFAAIEYPVASCRVADNKVILAHTPFQTLANGRTFRARTAIYGVSDNVKERFEEYLLLNKPQSVRKMTNYNSWWSANISYTEEEMLSIMDSFDKNLYQPFGIGFDTFCIDMGWSRIDGVWEISRERFPDGFTKLREKAENMNGKLGLWISPSNVYSPGSFSGTWAKENGYETFVNPFNPSELACCIALGTRYQKKMKTELTDLVKKYDISHIKFDGIVLVCDEPDHGHLTGAASCEAIAEGLIEIFQAVHAVNPDCWLEATCFYQNASPFWLLYCNSCLGSYGDDSPYGMIPAADYRESATTARDYYNQLGSDRLSIPVRCQETLGVIHQTESDFTNDAVMNLTRGNAFTPFYINPKLMNERRYEALSLLLKWCKSNQHRMNETETLRPAGWGTLPDDKLQAKDFFPKEAYGYAHWGEDSSLVTLRNPWIEKRRYEFTFRGKRPCNLYSIYPEMRSYGKVKPGAKVTIELMPYETLLLEASNGNPSLIPYEDTVSNRISLTSAENSTVPSGNGVCILSEATVTLRDDVNFLHVICEGKDKSVISDMRFYVEIDGVAVNPEYVNSVDNAWHATLLTMREFWEIGYVPIAAGNRKLRIEVKAGGNHNGIYAVLDSFRTKPVFGNPDLPSPEIIGTDSVCVAKCFREPAPQENG
ncbi:MAG: hypothetical protein ACI4S9_02290 [Christensenellales bacterium]